MSNLISISDARAKLPDLVDKVDKNMDRVVITVNGQPKATLISAEELESLEETAEILSIPNIKKDLAKSRKQIKKGEFVLLSNLK
ncbi:MAG: type II toxin-antitoxin system prevent-host-death family antitoxin [Candidatus Daviesbacteria bacterium]|nr:type II toxin-antitoxin system prevent-host-death family antitoxin [Candidatus Daviesbacteria bacterium]